MQETGGNNELTAFEEEVSIYSFVQCFINVYVMPNICNCECTCCLFCVRATHFNNSACVETYENVC